MDIALTAIRLQSSDQLT